MILDRQFKIRPTPLSRTVNVFHLTVGEVRRDRRLCCAETYVAVLTLCEVFPRRPRLLTAHNIKKLLVAHPPFGDSPCLTNYF